VEEKKREIVQKRELLSKNNNTCDSQMSRSRPTTPLRRISRGSLSALSGVSSNQTPLSFLDGAIADLADDAAVLHSNLEQINSIHQALGTFNESFSMLMYGLKMNAFCVEWPDVS